MQREQKMVLFLSVILLILMVVFVNYTKWVEVRKYTVSYNFAGYEQQIQETTKEGFEDDI